MQCPVCHNEVGPQSTFCNHCGASLSAAAPVPTPGFTEVPPAYTQTPPAYTAQPGYTAPPSGYAPPAGYAQQPPQQAYPPQAQAGSSGLSPTAAAALAYIFAIPAIIFLVIEPYNKVPLVRFHSFQAIGLVVVWIGFWIAMMILSMVLIFIPVVHLILIPIHLLVGLAFFIGWLLCVIKASKGEWFKLPVIGDFAMKQAQS
jgi:uncharacterized membrane protein